ncbi:TerB family tellurite resistance protein [Flavobacterium sp. FlaQc-57]|uniref:TerB family tellurite resistance protein n=1 Tax=Flavobacterium sp. FlaQc-57 TaxID=3374186 RepID=UPI0037571477
MRKAIALFTMIVLLCLPNKVVAQAQEIQQLILNIEKLSQFKQILSDMKKGYEILSGGYKAVKDMSEGNFSLHKTFLDALMLVSPVVKNYKRVGDIINYQVLLVKESKRAFNRFAKSNSFSPEEIAYFEKVYGNLLVQSIRNLDELLTIVTADKLRMSDDERLEAIDKIYQDMEEKLLFLRSFNSSSNVLALQRAREENDIDTAQRIHELKK